MQRIILIGVGGFALINASYMWWATEHWYAVVPGVLQTGPLNVHFAKDVALAFLSSGLALVWAGKRCDRSAAFFGSVWLVFHAVFHVWIWIHRGTPFDIVAGINLLGIQLPAFLALWAATKLSAEGMKNV